MGKHPLEIHHFPEGEVIPDCHILYIGLSSQELITAALEQCKSRPILTVSDANNFARMGGMVRFAEEEGRIRIRINIDPVNQSRLIISSKLLRLCEIVGGQND